MFQSGVAMFSKTLLSLLSLSLMAATAPAFAGVTQGHQNRQALADCYAEAQWPVTSSSGYNYGNARQRAQMVNGFDRETYTMRRVCYHLSLSENVAATAAQCGDLLSDSLKMHGIAARDHAVRQRDYCQALSGHAVTVDGL